MIQTDWDLSNVTMQTSQELGLHACATYHTWLRNVILTGLWEK